MRVTRSLPLKLRNPLNGRVSWKVLSSEARRIKHSVALVMSAPLRGWCQWPVVVTITRVSAGTLDAHDALPASAKHVVDSVAECLGIDDADKRVVWVYRQMKGKRGEYAVVIDVVAAKEVEAA